MQKIFSCVLALLALLHNRAPGQSPASATWALTANQNAVTTGNITATPESLTGLTHFDYISGGERIIASGGTWPAQTAPDPGRYLQYTVAPTAGNTLTVTEIKVSISFNGSSAGRAALSWSTDGIHFTNITTYLLLRSSSTPDTYTYNNLKIDVSQGQTLYFRISPFTTSVITGKYLVVKNVTINSTPTAAGWPLTANQNATAAGNITATPQALQGLTVSNYISGDQGQRVLPADTVWPAETGPSASRYLQYTASPASGNDLTITQVAMALSFNSSGYAHAKIAWSTDGISFTNLVNDWPLTSGSLPRDTVLTGLNIYVPNGKTFYLRVSPWTTGSINDPKFLVSKNIRLQGVTTVAKQLAFPGAEGGGRFARGGRNGTVYYVTNLNDNGAGSLRDAVSQPNRTILFKVSGTIFLSSAIIVDKDNITIAGQTAPGDGICLAAHGMYLKANNLIIRYIRSRPGDTAHTDVDAMTNYIGAPIPYSNIIVDHCSLSWSTDELGSFYAVSDFTLQWSMLSESLYYSYQHKSTGGDHTPHGYAGIWGGQQASFHHNLLAHNFNRNPRFSGSDNTGHPELEYVDFRNNVIYNWDGSAYGGNEGHQNMVNNYYKPGPATPGSLSCVAGNRRHRILTYTPYSLSQRVPGDTVWGGRFYIKGNYVHGYPCASDTTDSTDNNWTNGVYPGIASWPGVYDSIALARQNTPFPYAPVTTQSATDAFISVMDSVGAILPRRDTLDRRIIRETRTGTASFEDTSYQEAGITHPSGIIDSQGTVGGWPILTCTAYPNDTDGDGMPDWWESKITGNNADTTSITANSHSSDGYTMLEYYLNAIQSPDQQAAFTQLSAIITGTDSVQCSFTIDWAKDQFKFGLYRSTDNVSFTKIAETASNINTVRYQLYDYSAPHQQLYYKIGSTRIDGTGNTVYSNTVQIDNSSSISRIMQTADAAKEINELKIFPNPASNSIWLVHPAASRNTRISLFTADGQLIKMNRVKEGSLRTSIDIASFSPAVYWLVMDNGTSQQQISFVKY